MFNELLKRVVSFVVIFFWFCSWAFSADVEEVVVTANYIPDEKQETAEVADLLDIDDISISGDSNVGEALKRLPGLSLVGGRFIYVRGLGERYSSTYFNGTPVPSPEPLQRAVPLDLFDSAILSNILVQKTYSANYGADFSGGIVDIRSATTPTESYFKLQVGSGLNAQSTGESNFTYRGGDRDFLGFDDGSRDLPAEVSAVKTLYPTIFTGGELTALEQDQVRLSFTNNDWDIESQNNPHDVSLGTAFAKVWQPSSSVEIGAQFIGSFDNKWRNRTTQRNRYRVDPALAVVPENFDDIRDSLLSQPEGDPSQLGLFQLNNYKRTINTINSNMLGSVGLNIDDIHSFSFVSFLARKTTDEASITTEKRTDPEGLLTDYRLQWTENELFFNQLSGKHESEQLIVDWRFANIKAKRDVPEQKTYRRWLNPDEPDAGNLLNVLTNPARSFSFLEDTTKEFGIDFEVPLHFKHLQDVKLKFGFSELDSERRYEAFLFNYAIFSLASEEDALLGLPLGTLFDASSCVAGADINLTDDCYIVTNINGEGPAAFGSGAVLRDGFFSENSYDARYETESFYIALDTQINDFLRISAGFRNERSLQKVTDPFTGLLLTGGSVNPTTATPDQLPLVEETYGLPSASLTWHFTDNMQVRAAYSESINRPILRELAPVQIYNPEDGRSYQGNPSLRNAEITNWDLRYEWYFGDEDYFSLSAFKKDIRNPIELFEDLLDGESLIFRWQNIPSAENKGVEFELRKYFGHYFSVIANGTYIDSTTQLNDQLIAAGQTKGRSLVGLSEKLANMQFIYQDDSLTMSLAYNWFSERIFAVAFRAGEIVEQPFQSLDFNLSKSFFHQDQEFKLGFKVNNILEESVNIEYSNGVSYDQYDVGLSASLSFSWKMF